MVRKDFKKNQQGFTLIEMIVSLGVFSVVVTTAVGAILVLIYTNQRLQGEQSVMTNLSFALDTMTREIRTGYKYYCTNDTSISFAAIGTDTQDCSDGGSAVSFYEGGDSLTGDTNNRILYYYDNVNHTINRRIEGDVDSYPIVSEGLHIEGAKFYVTGSEEMSDGGTDVEQPTVTIYIEAREKDDENAKVYYLQTTVTQRALDI